MRLRLAQYILVVQIFLLHLQPEPPSLLSMTWPLSLVFYIRGTGVPVTKWLESILKCSLQTSFSSWRGEMKPCPICRILEEHMVFYMLEREGHTSRPSPCLLATSEGRATCRWTRALPILMPPSDLSYLMDHHKKLSLKSLLILTQLIANYVELLHAGFSAFIGIYPAVRYLRNLAEISIARDFHESVLAPHATEV